MRKFFLCVLSPPYRLFGEEGSRMKQGFTLSLVGRCPDGSSPPTLPNTWRQGSGSAPLPFLSAAEAQASFLIPTVTP